jgi:hypothetical protein
MSFIENLLYIPYPGFNDPIKCFGNLAWFGRGYRCYLINLATGKKVCSVRDMYDGYNDDYDLYEQLLVDESGGICSISIDVYDIFTGRRINSKPVAKCQTNGGKTFPSICYEFPYNNFWISRKEWQLNWTQVSKEAIIQQKAEIDDLLKRRPGIKAHEESILEEQMRLIAKVEQMLGARRVSTIIRKTYDIGEEKLRLDAIRSKWSKRR